MIWLPFFIVGFDRRTGYSVSWRYLIIYLDVRLCLYYDCMILIRLKLTERSE